VPLLFSEALLEEITAPREVAGEGPEYGNTREIGFICLLRLCLAVAIRQAECRADRLWNQKSGGFMSPNEPEGFCIYPRQVKSD
jgi:hypothetical protein